MSTGKKKLLFNGCSFVAGDLFCIEDYIRSIDKINVVKDLSVENMKKFLTSEGNYRYFYEYHNYYKRIKNLPKKCANLLNTNVVDLSVDGNNNTTIAIDTIHFLNDLSITERKEFYVVVGWTEPTRFTKYIEKDSYESIMIGNFEYFKNTNKSYYNFFSEYFLNQNSNDYLLNYMSSILLLEQYLKSNNINYMFFQGVIFHEYIPEYIPPYIPTILSPCEDLYNNDYHLTLSAHLRSQFRQKKIFNNFTDINNWYTFDDTSHSSGLCKPHPGKAWNDILNPDVDLLHGHPNIQAINTFSKHLSGYISNKL